MKICFAGSIRGGRTDVGLYHHALKVSGLLGGERYIGRMDGFEIYQIPNNGFIRTCCMQEIDQLRDEMEAIEIEVAG